MAATGAHGSQPGAIDPDAVLDDPPLRGRGQAVQSVHESRLAGIGWPRYRAPGVRARSWRWPAASASGRFRRARGSVGPRRRPTRRRNPTHPSPRRSQPRRPGRDRRRPGGAGRDRGQRRSSRLRCSGADCPTLRRASPAPRPPRLAVRGLGPWAMPSLPRPPSGRAWAECGVGLGDRTVVWGHVGDHGSCRCGDHRYSHLLSKREGGLGLDERVVELAGREQSQSAVGLECRQCLSDRSPATCTQATFGADDGTRTRDPHLGNETVGGSLRARLALW
jgi:hypothetical protein